MSRSRQEKKLQRELQRELDLKRDTLIQQGFALLDRAMFGPKLVYVNDGLAPMGKFVRQLLELGYQQLYDDRVANWMVVNVSDKTFWAHAGKLDEKLNWKYVKDVTFMELFHQTINTPPVKVVKVDTSALEQYIKVAIHDRLTWIKRREDQVRELRQVHESLQHIKTKGQLGYAWELAKRIRGTYGASQTNS